MTEKQAFATALRNRLTDLKTSIDRLNELRDVYIARGYGSSNAITDLDLTGLGVSVADISVVAQIIVDLQVFADGARNTTMNKLRVDI